MPDLPYKTLPEKPDCFAPDGSEIRLLSTLDEASSVHCRLPSGKTAKACHHKTVSEIWYILSGEGELWKKWQGAESVTNLRAGTSVTLPVGTHFQFRSLGNGPLDLFIATFPRWPGPEEAVHVTGKWQSNL